MAENINKQTILIVVCAWCGKKIGEKDGEGVEGVSDGICQDCYDKELKAI